VWCGCGVGVVRAGLGEGCHLLATVLLGVQVVHWSTLASEAQGPVMGKSQCKSFIKFKVSEILKVPQLPLGENTLHQLDYNKQGWMEVKRMDYTRYLKLALHGYVHGTRRQGRPKKRWIDMVKDDCKQRDLDIHQATEMYQHRSTWRDLVKLPMRAYASSRQ